MVWRSSIPPCELPPDYGSLQVPTPGLCPLGGALRIFGTEASELPSLARWNDESTWRSAYGRLADGLTFFAEDAFGNQFAWDGTSVVHFAAETAARERVADGAADWAELVAGDPDRWLVDWLRKDWVAANGPLDAARHLAPKVPFVLGTEAIQANLFVVDRFEDMDFKGTLASQLHGLPPGARVRFRFRERS